MGTRGYIGIKKDNVLKGMYNHFDSYPTGLGISVIEDINKIKKENRIKVLNETFDYIQLVNDDIEPTDQIIKECETAGVVNLGVSNQDLKDWYCLLRETQMNFSIYLNKKIPYMLDGNDFLKDELFCEWAYIIDLDENLLKVYTDGDKIIRAKFNLEELKTNDMKKLEKEIYGEE